jgi:CBS domain-containing protein
MLSVLQTLRVSDVVRVGAAPVCFAPATTLPDMLEQAGLASDQELFPVVSTEGRLVGLVTSATLRVAMAQRDDSAWVLAADLMQPPVSVQGGDDLRTTGERMLSSGLRELPIVTQEGAIVGLITESALAGVYLQGAARAEGEVSAT